MGTSQIVFTDASQMRMVSFRAMKAVINKYNLKPDENGEYRITDAMIKEAATIDKANKDPGLTSEEMKAMKAILRGEPQDYFRPFDPEDENA